MECQLIGEPKNMEDIENKQEMQWLRGKQLIDNFHILGFFY